ncbi:MAG: aminotransferase class I/II-fold pyridoxal phosphate-dependent enzyme [Pseudomonadota bacterium]
MAESQAHPSLPDIATLTERIVSTNAHLERTRPRGAGGQTALTSTQLPATSERRRSLADGLADLPGARRLALQRRALALQGLQPPFFRAQEPGPTAVTPRIDGAAMISFASYDYLGLSRHPAVLAAARAAMEREGLSAGASRLVGGERPSHAALENALAEHYGTEGALAFVSGHATNMAVLSSLLGPGDLVLLDGYAHNSLFEGAAFSGASRRTFAHNDLDQLERLLAEGRSQHRNALIAVESLYSMDGDSPDLPRLLEIRDRHNAWLMIDDAHGLGVLGPDGHGLAAAAGVDPARVDLWMGTLSKSLAATGGFVAGSAALIEFLRFRAAGFVFSVGLPPALAAGATAALATLQQEPERHARLARNGARFLDTARAAGLDTGPSEGQAITPVVVGSSLHAVALSQRLFEGGLFAGPIVHPAVPENAARLRFFITAEHTEAQIDRAVATTAAALDDLDAWMARQAATASQPAQGVSEAP